MEHKLIMTKNGCVILAQVIKEYPDYGKSVCFAQDRIVLCDNDCHEITSLDVFDILDNVVNAKIISVKSQIKNILD